MSGWVLFAIAMASLAATLIGLTIVVITGWRLAKHAGRLAGNVSHAMEPTLRGANGAAAKAAGLGASAHAMRGDLARLQSGLARLNVLNDAGRDGVRLWRKARSYVGR
jgi:hypothetical protein